jgi:hypothetical protein
MDDLSQCFIKKFNMPVDDKLGDYTYLVPLSTISHPLCVFKNYGGLNNEFFCVLPQRKWGGFFSAHIRRHINSGQTADTDDVGDSSSINLDDGVDSSSIGTLDFGDSSDDSSQSTSDERR